MNSIARLPLPQELAATFLGSPKLQNRARTAQVTRGDPRNLFTGRFEKKEPSRWFLPSRRSARITSRKPTGWKRSDIPCSHLIEWAK
jgi:hypothetical protein